MILSYVTHRPIDLFHDLHNMGTSARHNQVTDRYRQHLQGFSTVQNAKPVQYVRDGDSVQKVRSFNRIEKPKKKHLQKTMFQ